MSPAAPEVSEFVMKQLPVESEINLWKPYGHKMKSLEGCQRQKETFTKEDRP